MLKTLKSADTAGEDTQTPANGAAPDIIISSTPPTVKSEQNGSVANKTPPDTKVSVESSTSTSAIHYPFTPCYP